MKIDLPYGEITITAELPADTRLLSNVERAAATPSTRFTASWRRTP